MASLVASARNVVHLRGGAAAFSTSTSSFRWHKDVSARRQIAKYGYDDKTKMSGALPRIAEDEEKRWDHREVFTPENPWAQKRALFGQNDYIDILGEDPDAFRPSEVNYEQPEWLREVHERQTGYQRLLMKKKLLEETDYPETNPKSWEELKDILKRLYRKQHMQMDQYRFGNYKGITIQNSRGTRF